MSNPTMPSNSAYVIRKQRSSQLKDLLTVRIALFVKAYPSMSHAGVLASLFDWSPSGVALALNYSNVDIITDRKSAATLVYETAMQLCKEGKAEEVTKLFQDIIYVQSTDELTLAEIESTYMGEFNSLDIVQETEGPEELGVDEDALDLPGSVQDLLEEEEEEDPVVPM